MRPNVDYSSLKKYGRKDFFPEAAKLAKLGIPILIAQLATTAIGVVDTIMCGHYNAIDLAAVAIGYSFWMPIYLFITGIFMANTAIVAQAFGANDPTKIGHYLRQSLWLAIIISLLSMALLPFLNALIGSTPADPQVINKAQQYLTAVAIGIPAMTFYQAFRGLHEGMGNTRPIAVISIVAFLGNIPLNYMLIYGKWGLPELGAFGCGIATASMMWLSMFMLIFISKTSAKTRSLPLFTHWEAINFGSVGQLLKLGLPIGGATFVEISLFAIIALLLAPLGTLVIASHQIALNCTGLIFMLPLSLGLATTIRVGHSLGAKQTKQAHYIAKVSIVSGSSLSLLTCAGIIFCAPLIARIYTSDLQVQTIAVQLLFIAALYQLPDAIQACAIGALRGHKDTRVPLLLVLVAYWAFGLPLGYVLAYAPFGTPELALGVKGMWFGLVAGLSSAALLLSCRLIFIQRSGSDVAESPIRH